MSPFVKAGCFSLEGAKCLSDSDLQGLGFTLLSERKEIAQLLCMSAAHVAYTRTHCTRLAAASGPTTVDGNVDALLKDVAALCIDYSQDQRINALYQRINALKLDRAWAEAASSSTSRRVGERLMNEMIGTDRVNTNTTLDGLPSADQGEVRRLWTSFQDKRLKLPATTESEAQKFQPILEALWKHCAPANVLQVQGNKSVIVDNHRPDIMVLPAYECRAEFRTLVTGCEGKTNLKEPVLGKEAFGQLSAYVARTRACQLDQGRQFIYFSLCDLRRIVIVKCDLTKYPITATCTDYLQLLRKHRHRLPTEGFTALVRLLGASMAQLGYSDSGLPSMSINNQVIAVTERIAKGGHSFVYAATYHQGQKVAVKVLSSSIVKNFVAEYEVLEWLASNNIPMVPRAILFDEDLTKLVMSFCGVDRLADVAINESKSISDWLQIGVKLTRIMKKVHKLGIVHRDLRPENITTPDGKEFYIVDWGLAGSSGEVLPQVVGVAAYQSTAYLRAMREPKPCCYAFKAVDDLESIAYTIAAAHAGIPRRARKDILLDRAVNFEQTAPKQLLDYVNAVRAGKSYDVLCAILDSPSNEVPCGVTTTRGNACTQLKGKCRFHEKKNKE